MLSPMRTYLFLILCSLLIAAEVFPGQVHASPKRQTNPAVFVFPDARGPTTKTTILPGTPATPEQFPCKKSSRLAVLLTDEASSWLSLAHGLRTIGIPFCFTRNYQEALQHRVVMVYPTISGRVLAPDALTALAAFPKAGGTLIGIHVEGGGLAQVFGFEDISPSRTRQTIRFDNTHPYAKELINAHEQRIPFSNPTHGQEAFGSLAYLGAKHPLAVFDDGTAAITARPDGKGMAVAFGIDPGFLLSIGYNNREEGIARSYANAFEPTLDVLLRVIRNLYRAGEPKAVTLHTVPQGKSLAVILTHDIDYTQSLANAVEYARFEGEAGIPATYFVQTKYVRDWNDQIFLNHHGASLLRQLPAAPVEIASHSVAHSMMFHRLPLGTGQEQYPDYRPFVRGAEHTENASVLGELRISRFLLEHLLPGVEVTSFRPGHLRNPYVAPQAMAATGYRYSSSTTANNSLTHLPFQLTHDRAGKIESGVYEFPVTIEDEAHPRLLDRLPEALSLADHLARYGASLVVLIHTDITGHKLEFEKRLVAALQNRAWFGNLRSFGEFWSARDTVSVDITEDHEGLQVLLHGKTPVPGLTLMLPTGYRAHSLAPEWRHGQQTDGELTIDLPAGETRIRLIRERHSP